MADLSKELSKELSKDFAYYEDTIYRQAAIDALESIGSLDTEADKKYARSVFEALPSVQPECHEFPKNALYIRKTDAIEICMEQIESPINTYFEKGTAEIIKEKITELPSAQPEKRTKERAETHACDLIDREAAVDAIYHHLPSVSRMEVRLMLHEVPSAQPERTCVNCGRTVNNGGWYADGGTRCPIEEHYALPKDGYCHLWEKRNVTDDDYPERREE